MILRCPSCFEAINVKGELVKSARCKACALDIYKHYYEGWTPEAATKFIRSENARLKIEKGRYQRAIATQLSQESPAPSSKNGDLESDFDWIEWDGWTGIGELLKYSMIVICGLLLVANNPTKDDFKNFLKGEVQKNLASESTSSSNEIERAIFQASSQYAPQIVDYGLEITRQDMFIFSIYRVRVSGIISQLAGGQSPIDKCIIGIAGTYIQCPFQAE